MLASKLARRSAALCSALVGSAALAVWTFSAAAQSPPAARPAPQSAHAQSSHARYKQQQMQEQRSANSDESSWSVGSLFGGLFSDDEPSPPRSAPRPTAPRSQGSYGQQKSMQVPPTRRAAPPRELPAEEAAPAPRYEEHLPLEETEPAPRYEEMTPEPYEESPTPEAEPAPQRYQDFAPRSEEAAPRYDEETLDPIDSPPADGAGPDEVMQGAPWEESVDDSHLSEPTPAEPLAAEQHATVPNYFDEEAQVAESAEEGTQPTPRYEEQTEESLAVPAPAARRHEQPAVEPSQPAVPELSAADAAELDELSLAIDDNPFDPSLYVARGKLLARCGRLEEAVEDYTTALCIDPKFAEALGNRGLAFRDLEWYGDALEDFSELLELHPNVAKAWSDRGEILRRHGRIHEAVADLTKAVELDPRLSKAYQRRAAALMQRGGFEMASSDLDQVLSAEPDDALARYDRGLALCSSGDFAAALCDFERALSEEDAALAEYHILAHAERFLPGCERGDERLLAEKPLPGARAARPSIAAPRSSLLAAEPPVVVSPSAPTRTTPAVPPASSRRTVDPRPAPEVTPPWAMDEDALAETKEPAIPAGLPRLSLNGKGSAPLLRRAGDTDAADEQEQMEEPAATDELDAPPDDVQVTGEAPKQVPALAGPPNNTIGRHPLLRMRPRDESAKTADADTTPEPRTSSPAEIAAESSQPKSESPTPSDVAVKETPSTAAPAELPAADPAQEAAPQRIVADTPSIAVKPVKAQTLVDRGQQKLAAGQFAEALDLFSQAILMEPSSAVGYRARARALYDAAAKREAASATNFMEKVLADAAQAVSLDADHPDGYELRARAGLALGHHDDAARDALQCLRLNPGLADMYGVLGESYLHMKRYARAAGALSDQIRLGDATAEVYLRRGLAHQGNSQPDQAIADFLKAAQLNPTLRQAREEAAQLLMEAGDAKSAIAQLDQIVKSNPRDALALAHRGDVFARLKQWEKAAEDYTAAMELGGSEPELLRKRSEAFAQLGQHRDAVADLNTLSTVDAKSGDEVVRRRAETFFAAGDFEQAAADFADLLKAKPSDAELRILYAKTLLELGEPQKALHQAEQAIQRAGATADALRVRGAALLDVHEYAQAINDFDALIAQQPDDAKAHALRGLAHLSEARDELALADFNRAVKLDAAEPRYYAHRAAANLNLGRDEEVIEDCSAAIRLRDDLAEAYIYRGVAFRRLKAAEEALADFNQALDLVPGDRTAHFERARLLVELGESNQALDDLEVVLRADDHDALAWRLSGQAHLIAGRAQQAVTACDRAIELSPDFADAFALRCQAYQALGESRQATADMEDALRIDPANPDALTRRGEAQLIRGDFEAAIEDFNAALAADPHHADALLQRGIVNRKLSRNDIALADFTEAVKQAPGSYKAYSYRGTLLLNQMDYEGAVEDFNEALRLNPEHAASYYDRGRAFAALGDYQAATADYEQAVQRNPIYADAFYYEQ